MRIVVTAVDSEAGYVLTCLEESRCESNGELLNCVSGQLCNLCEAVWAIRRSTCGIQCSGIKNARSGANKSRITTALADHSGRSKVAVQKMTVIIATALPQQWSTGTVMLPFTQSKHDHPFISSARSILSRRRSRRSLSRRRLQRTSRFWDAESSQMQKQATQ